MIGMLIGAILLAAVLIGNVIDQPNTGTVVIWHDAPPSIITHKTTPYRGWIITDDGDAYTYTQTDLELKIKVIAK